jgi:hypothetical protein
MSSSERAYSLRAALWLNVTAYRTGPVFLNVTAYRTGPVFCKLLFLCAPITICRGRQYPVAKSAKRSRAVNRAVCCNARVWRGPFALRSY